MKKHTHEAHSEWYRLGFNRSEMKIRIAFGPQVLEHLMSLDLVHAIPFYGRGITWFDEFRTGKKFGFMGVFCSDSVTPSGLWAWEAQLPVFRSHKTQHESTPQLIQSLRATLALVFKMLYLFEGETASNIPQHIVMDGFLQGVGGGQAGLSAIITPPMAKWIAEHEDLLGQVERDMMNANRYMWSTGTPRDPFWFKANYKPKRGLGLCVDCNARHLTYGGNSDLEDGEGYEMHPHKIDSTLDQLTLLVGLCSLSEIASATIY